MSSYGDQVQLAIMRDGWMFLGVNAVFFCLQTLIRLSVTWSRNRLSSNQWILHQVLKFKPRRAKLHAKRNRWCQSDMWRLQLLSLTSVLLISNGSSLILLTDHYLVTIVFSEQDWLRMASVWPSDVQCPVFTLRRYTWSSGSWQFFQIVGLVCFLISRLPTV